MEINVRKIEIILAEQGITKTVFAKRCGLSRQNVSTILQRGTGEPRTAGKLANGLGVPLSDII